MIKSANEKWIQIKKVASDDDHTGINRVRAETNLQLEKVSDKNHVRKSVTKKLYELSKQSKSLTIKVIQSITKNFNYLLGQNHGNEEKISTGLKAVVEITVIVKIGVDSLKTLMSINTAACHMGKT